MANTAEDEGKEKIELTREELEEIVDRKVKERVEKELGKKSSSQNQEQEGEPELSRRSFLKKLGAGTIGLGTLSLIPSASALNIRSDSLSFYGGSGSGLDLNVDNSGNITSYGLLDINGNDIEDSGTTIWDSSSSHVPSSAVQSSGLDADTVDGQDASDIGGSVNQSTGSEGTFQGKALRLFGRGSNRLYVTYGKHDRTEFMNDNGSTGTTEGFNTMRTVTRWEARISGDGTADLYVTTVGGSQNLVGGVANAGTDSDFADGTTTVYEVDQGKIGWHGADSVDFTIYGYGLDKTSVTLT